MNTITFSTNTSIIKFWFINILNKIEFNQVLASLTQWATKSPIN